MRVYIAGPMSEFKDTDWNYSAFEAAAKEIRAAGDTAVCPTEIDKAIWDFHGQGELPPIMERRRVLALDLGMVLPTCDAILMLRGWQKSSGATAEYAAAKAYGLEVMHQPREEDE